MALESGIRACLSRGMVGTGDKAELAIEESEQFVRAWHGKGEAGLPACSPHAPYTCPPEYLQRVWP